MLPYDYHISHSGWQLRQCFIIIALLAASCVTCLRAENDNAESLYNATALVQQQNFIPSAKIGHIWDKDDFFHFDPAKVTDLEQRLRSIYDRHHYPVYVFMANSMMNEPLHDYMIRLKENWLGQNDGIIFIILTDSGKIKSVHSSYGNKFQQQNVSSLPRINESFDQTITSTMISEAALINAETATRATRNTSHTAVIHRVLHKVLDKLEAQLSDQEYARAEYHQKLASGLRHASTMALPLVILLIALVYIAHRYITPSWHKKTYYSFPPLYSMTRPRLGASLGIKCISRNSRTTSDITSGLHAHRLTSNTQAQHFNSRDNAVSLSR